MEGHAVSHLLDTNAWKWLIVGDKLKPAAKFLAEPETPLFLLDISFWEISKAVEHETLKLDFPPLDWMQTALKTNITVLTITPEIADQSCKLATLGLKTEDPADQLIVAAAIIHRLTLVTRDNLISKWGGVPVLNY
ncbi:MAG TPA: type II toxin-antitoxin system VapC family toxin [Verrucomicrobiae bacterium]|nr:type II toxin-antitoxin system VapC family toxin [Verrucomicrobiae bacterium]